MCGVYWCVGVSVCSCLCVFLCFPVCVCVWGLVCVDVCVMCMCGVFVSVVWGVLGCNIHRQTQTHAPPHAPMHTHEYTK